MAILERNPEKGYIIVDNLGECMFCRKKTNRIDYCFEARVCNECADKKLTNNTSMSKLEEEHCFKCENYYEGFICGFVISSDPEKDTLKDIMERRKNHCSLDKYFLENN